MKRASKRNVGYVVMKEGGGDWRGLELRSLKIIHSERDGMLEQVDHCTYLTTESSVSPDTAFLCRKLQFLLTE